MLDNKITYCRTNVIILRHQLISSSSHYFYAYHSTFFSFIPRPKKYLLCIILHVPLFSLLARWHNRADKLAQRSLQMPPRARAQDSICIKSPREYSPRKPLVDAACGSSLIRKKKKPRELTRSSRSSRSSRSLEEPHRSGERSSTSTSECRAVRRRYPWNLVHPSVHSSHSTQQAHSETRKTNEGVRSSIVFRARGLKSCRGMPRGCSPEGDP